MVKVLPEPVTPSSTWSRSMRVARPSPVRRWRWAGRPPGSYSDTSLNLLPPSDFSGRAGRCGNKGGHFRARHGRQRHRQIGGIDPRDRRRSAGAASTALLEFRRIGGTPSAGLRLFGRAAPGNHAVVVGHRDINRYRGARDPIAFGANDANVWRAGAARTIPEHNDIPGTASTGHAAASGRASRRSGKAL